MYVFVLLIHFSFSFLLFLAEREHLFELLLNYIHFHQCCVRELFSVTVVVVVDDDASLFFWSLSYSSSCWLKDLSRTFYTHQKSIENLERKIKHKTNFFRRCFFIFILLPIWYSCVECTDFDCVVFECIEKMI